MAGLAGEGFAAKVLSGGLAGVSWWRPGQHVDSIFGVGGLYRIGSVIAMGKT